MTQYGAHMKQLNDVNEGNNIEEYMGVFSGGSHRLTEHNLYYFYSKAPTQGGNYVATIVSTTVLQYHASLDVASLLRSAQTSL